MTEELNRYSQDMDGSMEPDTNGQWVRFEDAIALPQRPAAQEVEISTKHGPWLPSRHHDGETYCERCLTRNIFASNRACDPHIVPAPQQATPEPERITVQEAWEAAGGNPGIKASKADLLEALRQLDKVCDEATPEPDTCRKRPRCGRADPCAWDGDARDRLTVNLLRQGAGLTKNQIRALIAQAVDGTETDPALFHATPEPVGEHVATVFTMEALDPWTFDGSGPRCHVNLHVDLPAGTKLYTRPAAAPAVPEGWREAIEKMVKGIDHLAELARQWEPDYSSGADRKGWVLAKNARDEAVDLLAAAQAKGGV